jgi:hypothetical protein
MYSFAPLSYGVGELQDLLASAKPLLSLFPGLSLARALHSGLGT